MFETIEMESMDLRRPKMSPRMPIRYCVYSAE
jgi:hypothetical protein